MESKAKALTALSIAAVIWGLNSYVSKFMLPFGTPLTFIVIRFFCSSSILLLFLMLTKQCSVPKLKYIPILFLLGLFSVVMNNTFVLVGLQYSSVINFSIINATSPLFIAIFAYIFLKEKLLIIQWFGIFLALFGMVFILTSGNIRAIFSMEFNKGDIIFLASQVGWAAYTLVSSRMLKHITVFELVCYSGFCGVIINIIYGAFSGELAMPEFNTAVIGSLVYTTLLSTIVAILFWNFGVKTVGASISGIFLNLSTLIGIASGVLFLGEPFNFRQVYGIASVFLGIFLLLQYQLIQKFLLRFSTVYTKNSSIKSEEESHLH